HELRELPVNTLVVGVMHILTAFALAISLGDHRAQQRHTIANLAFGQEYRAAPMSQVGVWAVENKEIGETRNGDAEIGTRIVNAPYLSDRAALAALDVHWPQHARSLEAGCENDYVRFN